MFLGSLRGGLLGRGESVVPDCERNRSSRSMMPSASDGFVSHPSAKTACCLTDT